MRRVLGAACAALGIATGATVLTVEGRATVATSHVERERVRLRAHFDSVLVELGSRDVTRLTSEQRASRARLTAWLAEYRDAGAFPLNDLGTAAPVPIFRDSRGVLCAMAYLIDRSGRTDLVDDVEATRNTAYIAELIDDDRLVAWLDSTGLGADEAARIQPLYPGPPETVDRSYAVGSMVLGSLSTGLAVASFLDPTETKGVVGLAVGAFTLLRETSRGRYTKAGGRLVDSPDYESGQPGYVQVRSERDEVIKTFGIVTGSMAILSGARALLAKSRRQDSGVGESSSGRNQETAFRFHAGPWADPATGRLGLTLALARRL